MKKTLFIFLALLLPYFLYAHKILLNVYSNDDNTITIEGTFNTGESASGAMVQINSLITNKTILKQRLSDDGELIIEIPNEPYEVVLNAGRGHSIVQKGIEPVGGYSSELLKKAEEAKKTSVKQERRRGLSFEMLVSISITSILLLLTIFISIKNTRLLMNQMKNSK